MSHYRLFRFAARGDSGDLTAGVRARRRRGMGRREVVFALVAVSLGVALVVLNLPRQRAVSRRLICEERQMEAVQAIIRFDGLHGRLPGYRDTAAHDSQGQPRPASWVFPILPYLRYDDKKQRFGPHARLYDAYGPDADDEHRGRVQPEYLPDLTCPEHSPDDPRKHPGWLGLVVNCGLPDGVREDAGDKSESAGNTGAAGRIDGPPAEEQAAGEESAGQASASEDDTSLADGLFYDAFPSPKPGSSLAYVIDHDGADQTLMLTENLDCGAWTDTAEQRVGFLWSPDDGRILAINVEAGKGDHSLRFARPSSLHGGGVNAVSASSAARFVSERIDLRVWRQMMAADDSQAGL